MSSGSVLPAPKLSGPALLCCPGEVRGSLSRVLQLVGAGTALPLLEPSCQLSHLSLVLMGARGKMVFCDIFSIQSHSGQESRHGNQASEYLATLMN